jgi:hypothetical protein
MTGILLFIFIGTTIALSVAMNLKYRGITSFHDSAPDTQIAHQLKRQVDILQRDRWDRQARLGYDYWQPKPGKRD